MRLLAKPEYLQNHSRRSNLRVVGIPENTEAQDPVAFMSAFFAEVLGSDFFPTPPVLDRAHRIGPTTTEDARNWARVIVCFLYHKERVARRRGDQLYFRGTTVPALPKGRQHSTRWRLSCTRKRWNLESRCLLLAFRSYMTGHGYFLTHLNKPKASTITTSHKDTISAQQGVLGLGPASSHSFTVLSFSRHSSKASDILSAHNSLQL